MWRNKLAEKLNKQKEIIDYQTFLDKEEILKQQNECASSIYKLNYNSNKTPTKCTAKTFQIKSKSPEIVRITQFVTQNFLSTRQSQRNKLINFNSQNLSKQYESFMKQKRESK